MHIWSSPYTPNLTFLFLTPISINTTFNYFRNITHYFLIKITINISDNTMLLYLAGICNLFLSETTSDKSWLLDINRISDNAMTSNVLLLVMFITKSSRSIKYFTKLPQFKSIIDDQYISFSLPNSTLRSSFR